MSDNITDVNDKNFREFVIDSQDPVLVDFWATWCSPCKVIGQALETMVDDYRGRMKFVKCNIEESSKVSAEYGIRSVPTLLIFKNGQIISQLIGAVPKKELSSFLDRAL